MGDKKVSICFIGCGSIAAVHANHIKKRSGQFDLCFASRDLIKAKKYCKRFGGKEAFGSYVEAADSKKVNIFFICTPPGDHFNSLRIAAESGKDVIVEKPAARNVKEIESMIKLIQRNAVRCMVAENYQFKPSLLKISNLLASGIIGEPFHIELKKSMLQVAEGWRGKSDLLGGGALLEGGVHWIRAMTMLGGEVVNLSAISPDYEEKNNTVFETTVSLSLKYKGNLTGNLFHSWSAKTKMKGLSMSRIYGSDGIIHFESNGIFILVRGKKSKLYFPSVTDMLGFKAMHKEIADCFISGKKIISDLNAAKNDIAIVEAAYRSIKNDSVERLSPH